MWAPANLTQLHAHVAKPPLAVPIALGVPITLGVAPVLNLFALVCIDRIETHADPAEISEGDVTQSRLL